MRALLSMALALFAIGFAVAAPSSRAFTLPDSTGIVEGLAYRESTGDFFLGDVHHRCVWRRDRAGHLTRFSPPGDELFGVFNLIVDEPHARLWAATSIVAETARSTAAEKGRAALVALDLATGRIVEKFPLPDDPRPHVLGDLALAPDGTIFVTDSLAPIIWRLAPRATALENLLESSTFRSLQGLALLPSKNELLVSDYARGLFIVNLTTRAIRLLDPPPGNTLRGIDGLLLDGRTLIAVQNGHSPERLLRLALSSAGDSITSVEILASGPADFADLTLLTRALGQLYVIANSGWALAKDGAVPAHEVRVFRLQL